MTVLKTDNITMRFGGLTAVSDFNLEMNEGEIVGLIGPNGAGKTTLMDVITGKTRPDSGSVYFGQTMDLLQMDEPAIAQAGICRKFQKPSVFEKLTVFENLELSMKADKGAYHLVF